MCKSEELSSREIHCVSVSELCHDGDVKSCQQQGKPNAQFDSGLHGFWDRGLFDFHTTASPRLGCVWCPQTNLLL